DSRTSADYRQIAYFAAHAVDGTSATRQAQDPTRSDGEYDVVPTLGEAPNWQPTKMWKLLRDQRGCQSVGDSDVGRPGHGTICVKSHDRSDESYTVSARSKAV